MSPEQLPVRGAFLGPVHTVDTFEIHSDCRHFAGGRPCRHWRPCHGCPHRDPVDHRVLIVMLGLLGDMLIASPLPARIRAEKPGAHITWLVDEACAPILRTTVRSAVYQSVGPCSIRMPLPPESPRA